MNMPGFMGEVSLYKTSRVYKLAAKWSGGSEIHLGPAQFLGPPGSGPKGCVTNSVDVSECPTGCKRTCNIGGEITETCVSANNCHSVSCGPCLLPTGAIREKIIAGLPIDPATDLVFQQSCQQGTNSFTQGCEICSDETRISLPIVSDKCIRVCMSGFDPSSIRVVVRDC
jgi:hypothetical protein